MDPNANWKRQQELAKLIIVSDDSDACYDAAMELAVLVEQMNDWLTNGGSLPDAWKRSRR